MKTMKTNTITMILGSFLLSTLAWTHDGTESRVSIESDMSASLAPGQIHYVFQMIDVKTKKVLTDADLNIVHEKKLHFFVFDKGLKEFRHEHPLFLNGVWSVDFNLQKNGDYFFWAQGEIASDQEEFKAFTQVSLSGGSPANPLPAVLGNIRRGADNTSIASLSGEKLVAGKMVMPILTFTRSDGSVPDISNYLGAKAHVIAVTGDGDQMMHVHPMEMTNPNKLMIHCVFPEAGDYRVWVQFVDSGLLRTVPLSVTVVN